MIASHLLALFIVVFFSTVDSNPRRKLPPLFEGKVFSQSSDSPIVKALNKSETFIQSTRELVNHFDYIANHIDRALEANRASQTTPVDSKSTKTGSVKCNSEHEGWFNATRTITRMHGWKSKASHCTSDIYDVPNPQSHNVTKLISALQTRHAEVKSLHEKIRNETNLPDNFTQIVHGGNDNMASSSINCSLEFTGAIRSYRSGMWYVLTTLLNINKNTHARRGKRVLLSEYISVSNGSLINEHMCLPREVPYKNGTRHEFKDDTTTKIAFWDGAPSTSSFFSQTIEENGALINALQAARLDIHHAEDTLAWSNLAILSLPLFTNLVPVSIISNIQRPRTFLLVFLSDIIGTIPMLIKSIEIILISRKKFITALTRMTDPTEAPSEGTISAELWIAQCKATDSFQVNGIILLVVAISSFITAIVIELLTHTYGRRRFQSNFVKFQESFVLKVNEDSVRNVIISQVPEDY